MAHIDDGNGKKSANVELNIVPVIDLMSVLIVFLLITAVWNQVSMIQLGTSVYGKKTANQTEPPKNKNLEIPLRLDVKLDGYVVNIGSTVIPIRMLGQEYDGEKLAEELKVIKERYPEKRDLFLQVDDKLKYEAMVKGMDVAIGAGFDQIAVTTGSAR